MKNVVIALALIAAAFLLGRRSVKPEIVEIHRKDTVVVRDTVRETVLVPKVRYLTRVDTVLLLVPGDTVKVPVLVPISRKVYEGEDYRAVVSGFRASLDTLDIFRKTQTVTNTVVQRVEVPGKPKRWGIGVSAGYALTPQGVKPYIGAGISYSFITF
jgi:anti-sigma-K factor RskA